MAARKNVILEQRRIMLQYMEEHDGLLKGRFDAPDSEQLKKRHWGTLTTALNSVGGGAIKDVAKWQRSWSDWKSDTRLKAGKIKAKARGTGGGPPVAPLTELEERLVALLGVECVDGLAVPDPPEEDNPTTSSAGQNLRGLGNEPPEKRAKVAGTSVDETGQLEVSVLSDETPRRQKAHSSRVIKSTGENNSFDQQVALRAVEASEASASALQQIAETLKELAASSARIEQTLLLMSHV